MFRSTWNLFVVTAVVVASVMLIGTMSLDTGMARASEDEAPEPAPPADQTFVGSKVCASCHFNQFMTWKADKHSKTFDLLPAKYQTDPKCLKCHTVGYGQPTGYKDTADVALKGTGCETCHGAGSKHAEIAQALPKENLTAEQEKSARDAIWKMLPKNICVTCHLTKAHKESATPPELRSKD